MSSEQELDELDLLRRVSSGETEAFDRLVSRYRGSVVSLGRVITRSEALAEEVAQEAFLAVFRHAGGFRGESSFRTWLFTVARHAAWRLLRREPPAWQELEPLDELGAAAGWGAAPDPQQACEEQERRERLAQTLASLEERDREILQLREIEGLSGQESAQVLGIPLAAMKTRLHRARLRLMIALRKGGLHASP